MPCDHRGAYWTSSIRCSIRLFPNVVLLYDHEVGKQWNLFKPLPGCQADLRARDNVTPDETGCVGYRTQPPRIVAVGEKDHRVRRTEARRGFVALQKRHFAFRKPVRGD